jgi:hypothetical protein
VKVKESGYAIFATSNLESLFWGMMMLHRHKLDHERALLPYEVAPLLDPVLALREHFEVEIPEDLAQEKTHLEPSETIRVKTAS